MSRLVLSLLGLSTLLGNIAHAAEVDFTRDVRPLLSKHCFKCHGPDEKARQAELRLDVSERAIGAAASGKQAIVPGRPDESELVRRVFSQDENEIMPPPAARLPLTDDEKQILRTWIETGAEYVPHWAFVAPHEHALPPVQRADWPRNPIDHFVLAKMESEGLAPSPEADKYALIRRLSLDLIGIPPTPEEAQAFVEDHSPEAYEKLVDRLLASSKYGERFARKWLDLARYADTNGYEKDRVRSLWPYRDWVIGAINTDLPFDQFTVEQIAGDMLPQATVSQRIATGFHRNTMLNEEGGIDPLEFRFHAMTDRVATTGTVWLGLTMVCSQCHTHKYDPIAQREYYQMFAYLNNADEPAMDIPQPQIAARRQESAQKIQSLIDDLPNQFPLPDEYQWSLVTPARVTSAGGATLEIVEQNAVLVSGTNPDQDTYTVELESTLPFVDAIRLEALSDARLPSKGPGRTPHGNFVLSEFSVQVVGADGATLAAPLALASATADFSQEGYPAANAIDGQPTTGWAIHGPGEWNVDRTCTLVLDPNARIVGPAKLSIRLDQQHGSQHTLGKFRIQLGQREDTSAPEEARRRAHLERKMNAWIEREAARVRHWTLLRPTEAKSNMPVLTILEDCSVLASSDQTKRDVYDLKFQTDLVGIRALRLEAIPDDRLPNRGPGRVFYEGGFGDFYMSNMTLKLNDQPARFSKATHSFAAGATNSANVIDENLQSGWSINGRQGEPHEAVFQLAEPLATGGEIALQMVFEMYYAAGMGRFRIWATTDAEPAEATSLPRDVEEILLLPAEQRTLDTCTPEQRQRLLAQFCQVAPELAEARAQIQKVKSEMPAFPTTLVMTERPANETRATHLHYRGEFLQPQETVEPGVPAILPPVDASAPKTRLSFARWLVSESNPLTARVLMNRHWGTIFGKALVKTQEDFGYRGETPTHPELLDWLAVEFMRRGWSLKQMHRLMVTSATYRQASEVSPELLAKDPSNRWLARGSRFRIDAELVRDSVLSICGLLSSKVGGPSVFPPQPAGVTSEGAFGGLTWNVSPGEDRYRRGMYTFSKRTAPYAMFTAFDSPSGEACVARREVSNTPLQALTLMNDTVFWEASQALGKKFADQAGTVEERIDQLWRRCLVRPGTPEELALLADFLQAQQARLAAGELDAAAIAGDAATNVAERAAWTVLARAILNLDETITRN